jgi:dTMP kinase
VTNAQFIAFEGNDGSGKSTTAKLVADRLRDEGHDIFFLDKNCPTFQSGYAAYHMGKIREILWDYDNDAPLEVLGDRHWIDLIAAWFHGLENCVVMPQLERGRTVIADGWVAKYLARFLLKDRETAECANAVFSNVMVPDAVIFLDVEPQIAFDRKTSTKRSERGELERASKTSNTFVDYQNSVREKLLSIADDSWTYIETSFLNVEGVSSRATDVAKQVLSVGNQKESRLCG